MHLTKDSYLTLYLDAIDKTKALLDEISVNHVVFVNTTDTLLNGPVY